MLTLYSLHDNQHTPCTHNWHVAVLIAHVTRTVFAVRGSLQLRDERATQRRDAQAANNKAGIIMQIRQ